MVASISYIGVDGLLRPAPSGRYLYHHISNHRCLYTRLTNCVASDGDVYAM